MAAPLKLGFGTKLKAAPAQKASAAAKKASAFDDEDEAGPIASTSKNVLGTGGKKAAEGPARMSREQKKLQEEAQKLDESVFLYDEVYDNMKSGERKAAEQRAQENAERKPRYIEGLLRTAAQRKLDFAAAEDKMMERERAREGGQFDDKDAFVTPAYLAQQEEIRKAEEEERKRDEAAGKKRSGLPAFYAEYLNSNEEAHAAAVKAASERPKIGPTMPPGQDSDDKPTEASIAAEASKRLGRNVVVNEDGQIVDKRELLTGGLNIQKKPKAANGESSMGFAVPIADRAAAAKADAGASELDDRHKPLPGGLTPAQRHRLMRERQSADIEQQMLESQAKKRAAEEAEAAESAQRYVKRTATDRVEELKRAAAERRAAREAQLAAEVTAPPAQNGS